MMATDVIVSGGDDAAVVEASDCSPSPPPPSLVSAKNGQLTNMAQQGVSNGSNLSAATGDGGSDANDTNSNNISSSCDSGDIVEVNRDDDQVNGASPGGHSLARPPSLEPLATAGASVPVSVCSASAAADSDTEPSAKRLCVDSVGAGTGTVTATVTPPAVGAATATDVSGLRAFELIESSLLKLKREVRALDLLVRQKEREWDCLIKLRKTKEETFQRLRRKRKVLLLQASDTTLSGASVSTGATAAMTPLVAAAVSDAGGSLRRLAPANQRKVPSLPSLSVAGVAALTAASGGATTSLPFSLPSYTQSMALRKPIASHQPASLPPSSALAASLQPPSSMVAAAAAAAAASANDARFRDALAQIIKMNKPTPELSVHQLPRPAVDQLQQQPPPHQAVTASSAAQQLSAAAAAAAAAVASNQHHQQQSSLAKLLIESKRKQSDAVLSEILKHPQMSLVTPMARASAAISPLSQPTRATPPVPPPPPPAPSESVPLCQGCRLRQAQFVCAGCGNQWYCSRDCQVASWDSHADECTG